MASALLLAAGVIAGLVLAGGRVRFRGEASAAGLTAAFTLPALGASVAVALAAAAGCLAVVSVRRAARRRIEARRAAIEAALPDALDLLAGVVQAGAPLDAALVAVAARTPGPLGLDLAACAVRLGGGGARGAAFTALGAGGPADLARVADTLATADELGAPLAALLREQAALQRELRRLRVRERAAQAAPKIALVVAFVLVPAGLLLVLGTQGLALLSSGGGLV